MAHEEEFRAVIEINSKNAQNELKKLESDLKTLEDSQKRLLNSKKKGDAEAGKSMQKNIDDMKRQIGEQKKYIAGLSESLSDLSKKSYKQLRDTVKALEKELRSGHWQKHSKEWEAIAAKISEAKKEMKAFNIAAEETQNKLPLWKRVRDGMNKNFGFFTQSVAAVSGISMTVRNAVNDYAAMEQEMANVRKYTGQTAEEVERLNERLKQMDTRTSREELNQLAGAAGRLGITSTEQILEFVDAADKINVALGDDLGQGAVDTIGKLAIAFGESDRLGLRGAMLATGSALNEIVQSSSAQAQPVVEFTAKLSGVGQQAHMTQAEIMGFASALDQNNQEMATSSTVMSQLITKMYQDPAKFAKMAGLEVKNFTETIKTNMNEGLIQWFQAVNKLGDMSVLAGKFDELNMDGTRAVGVLATLAGHIDQVTEAQKTASEAYEKQSSVIEEFNVQNNNVQAGIDKAKKRFKEITIELGQKLLPVVKYTVSGTSLLVKGLSSLFSLIGRYKYTIIGLTAAITGYKIAVEWANITEKAHSYWITVVEKGQKLLRVTLLSTALAYNKLTGNASRAAAAQRMLNAAGVTHPYAAVASAAAAAAMGIGLMIDKMDAAKKASETLADITADVESKIAKERFEIETLTKVINSNVLSEDQRREALETLNGKMMDMHLRNLTEEEIRTGRANSQLATYLNLMKKKLEMTALENEIQEQQKTLLEAQQTIDNIVNNNTSFLNRLGNAATMGALNSMRIAINVDDAKVAEQTIKRLEERRNALLEEMEKEAPQHFTVYLPAEDAWRNGQQDGSTGGGGQANGETEKEKKERLKRERENERQQRKAAAAERAAERAKEKDRKKTLDDIKRKEEASIYEITALRNKGEISYREMIKQTAQAHFNAIVARQSLYEKDSEEYKRLESEKEKIASERAKRETELDIQELEREKVLRESAIRAMYYDKNSEIYANDDALREALLKNEIEYLQKMRDKHAKSSEEYWQYEQRITDRENQDKLEKAENYQKRLSELRQNYGRMDIGQLKEIELNGLEKLHEEGLVAEEEYQKIRLAIIEKYANEIAEQRKNDKENTDAKRWARIAGSETEPTDTGTSEDMAGAAFGFIKTVQNQQKANEMLKQLYEEGKMDYATYCEAKKEIDRQMWTDILSHAQTTLEGISNLVNAASSYSQACSNLEVAQITANYDKQIAAASKNSKKKERLEKQKEEAIAKAKTKANKKAMIMEMAQAVAQTAMGAISAYSSTMAGAPYPANLVLAPISAGIALAAGAIQIATIKKQHEAEALGYYEGGFTGGRHYRREAGVVHEGEFVANHQAVNNRNLAPLFSFIDQAQRNNKVASLKAEDVTNIMGGPAATSVVAPIVNVQGNNHEMLHTLEKVCETQDRLATQLEQGIGVDVPIDGENGIYRRIKQYENLMKNK